MKLSSMRSQEVVADELAQVEAFRDELKERARKLASELDMIAALAKINELPAAIRSTVLGALGIESEEAVGAPGGK